MKFNRVVLIFSILFAVCINVCAAPSAQDLVKASGVTGGLVVHVVHSTSSGQGADSEFTAGLLVNDRYIVQGLYSDGVEKARAAIAAKGLYGKVSISQWDGKALPYSDNLVNLLVVDGKASLDKKEMLRVLAPRGVALIDGKKIEKPVPSDIDDWTHYLHGPDNNAVAKDYQIAPPYHTQWEGAPRWQRSHDTLASLSTLVSSEGRLFYIHDEGERSTIALPAKWFLVSRDAFNGIILWKRPIDKWHTHFRGFRSGPAHLSRRLVAVNKKVYVTMGFGEPISVLDADTGKILMEYKGTEGAHEIIVEGDVVYAHLIKKTDEDIQREFNEGKEKVYGKVVTEDVPLNSKGKSARRKIAKKEAEVIEPEKSVMAINAKTGEILWERTDNTDNIPYNTLTVGNGKVFYQNSRTMFCLNAKTGALNWKADRGGSMGRDDVSTPNVVLHKDVLLWADKDSALNKKEKAPKGAPRITGKLIAYSVKDGKELWSCLTGDTFRAPFEVFVMEDVVWTGGVSGQTDRGLTEGRDYITGKVIRTRTPDNDLYQIAGHASCYRNKATERFLIMNRAGMDFLDVKNDKAYSHHFTRGVCQYGMLPANGLSYQPPHACNCYIYAKLSGYVAMAGKRYTIPDNPDNLLEKGPAFAKTGSSKPASSFDWPTYRYDSQRSSALKSSVSTKPKKDWELDLKGDLTQPVAVGNLLYVANRDTHTLHAIDVSSGKIKWSYIAGGEVDSPPTIYKGLALFGCADGWVYCLDAGTGQLAWRFRAAHNNQQIVSYGQIKSIWPVPGNVLVMDGKVYFAAGRTSYMDGGIFLYKLDVKTGDRLAVHRIYDRNPETDLEPQDVENIRSLEGALPDILSSDGKSIFLRHRRFDLDLKEQPQDVPHLFSSVGFLDDDWWHRTFWQFGNIMLPGYGGWGKTGNSTVSGQLLSFNDTDVYGFGHKVYGNNIYYGMPRNFGHYRLFNMPKSNVELSRLKMDPDLRDKDRKKAMEVKKKEFEFGWAERVKLLARAMILAGDKIVVAGPPDVIADEPMEPAQFNMKSILDKLEKQNDIYAGKHNGILMVVSTKDGKVLSEQELQSPPVFNGMIVAKGKLFITDTKGRVICYK